MATIPQPSLAGGELAPSLHGRVDLALYGSCLKTCKNFIVQAYGGVVNRPGSRFIKAAYSNSRQSRLVPFTFNSTQNYVLEICGATEASSTSIVPNGGNGIMRIFSRGKVLVYESTFTEGGVTFTKDNPITVAVPWFEADLRQLKFSQSADVLTVTHPSYPPCQILRQGSDRWGIRRMVFKNGPFQPENTDKGIAMAVTDAGEPGSTVVITTNLTTTSKDLSPFKNATKGQLVRLRQQNYGTPWESGKAVLVGDIRRSDGKYYRAVTAGTTGTLRPTNEYDTWKDGGGVTTTGGTVGVEWEYIHSGFGVGEILDIDANYLSATVIVKSRFPAGTTTTVDISSGSRAITELAASPSGGLRVTATAHAIGSAGLIFPADGLIWYYNTASTQDSISFENAQCRVVDANTIDIEVSYSALNDFMAVVPGWASFTPTIVVGTDAAAATYKWSIGAWGGDQGWPTCSGYFEQRHCFAGTAGQPQTVWTSRTGDYENFGTSEPSADDDALTFTIASAQIDGIQSMLPMDRLVLFTLGGNWTTRTGNDDVLTPGNLNAKLQSYHGASLLGPLGVGNSALYYGKSGAVRDMAYDFGSDKYVGDDLAVKANHLLKDHWVVEWDFQQTPYPIVWMVRDDGMLIGMTYLREEKVIGWHQHDIGGDVESIAIINECGEDHLYLVVNRSGTRQIECVYERTDDLYEACFLDNSLSYDGRNTDTASWVNVNKLGANYNSGSAVQVTSLQDIWTTGAPSPDILANLVLEGSDGTQYRVRIDNVVSASDANGVLLADLPAALQNTHTTSWGIARLTLSGLAHLNGLAVGVYADGSYGTGTVSAGAITLSGCTPALAAGLVATVGTAITGELESLPLVVPGNQGPLRENVKLIHAVRLIVENSRSTYIGPDASNLLEAKVRDPNNDMVELTSGSGIMDVNTIAAWNKNGQFLIRHTKPYPLAVLALHPDVSVGNA